MTKIITLTLNPALDCASTTPRIIADGKLRCSTPAFEPGGGGINVSRAIHKLGGESTALYPAGGSSGEHLTQLLLAEGVLAEPSSCQQWTRQNLNVVTTHDNAQYRFIMPGTQLSIDEQSALLNKLNDHQDAQYCVISGSVADNMPGDIVADVIKFCQQHTIKVIYDGSGDALKQAVTNGGLYLIKPNANELAVLTNSELIEPAELEDKARQIISEGKAQIVLVSLGPQGALLVTKDICEQIVPPRVQKNSTVGAGDSLVGATVLSLANGQSIREAARRGVAAGTAATMNHGSELCKAKDVESIFEWICKKYPL
ncbi:6-phosphofructokinase II [Psychromonas antarctica]|jgi:6-phosphofructokinase 2|uniref:6-phosphofructokinase II n=1 Tax=Psychromonas antarctica TaxID=67573 RepID=UPI001EE781F3|nr:6-phosphofructokinase II [Psychromonas antarctica]MCG6201830.1 6-phosphofructokinase II [Psychromonas antarctica]